MGAAAWIWHCPGVTFAIIVRSESGIEREHLITHNKHLRVHSGDVLQVETGSLYPALHRLERQGWVSSEWKQTESKQRAKYYRITAAGKKRLSRDLGRWQQMVDAVAAVMQREPKGSDA